MALDPERLMERIRMALSAVPASIDAMYELAFDEHASSAARQYAIRSLLRYGRARPESVQANAESIPEPMSEKTRAVLEAILKALK